MCIRDRVGAAHARDRRAQRTHDVLDARARHEMEKHFRVRARREDRAFFLQLGADLAVAHNGNLVNAGEIRAELEEEGSIFTTSSDTEVFLHLMARSRVEDVVGALRAAVARVRGAYSI